MKTLQGYKISYAQNKEDRIIEAFFPDISKGFYVDVGANDPDDDSVTKLFYESGWSGINIEPNNTLCERLKIARKRDITINVGVSDKNGEINFREYINHGLSTFSEDTKKQNKYSDDPSVASYKDYKVKVRKLSDIFLRYAPAVTINFMKVDVEGYEYEVLAGNDWSKYRPELLCIEANHVNHDWRPLIKKAGYSEVFDDGLNKYYLRDESIRRKEYFDYANAMILSGVIISPGTAKRIISGDDARAQLQRSKIDIEKLHTENQLLNSQLNELNNNTVRFHADKLMQGIKKSLKKRYYR